MRPSTAGGTKERPPGLLSAVAAGIVLAAAVVRAQDMILWRIGTGGAD
ncbi:MAG: hypothetical protein MI785_22970 [Kiloniellales bacterium]|nr:hypothetical protein [Kiloniellales bacterium]